MHSQCCRLAIGAVLPFFRTSGKSSSSWKRKTSQCGRGPLSRRLSLLQRRGLPDRLLARFPVSFWGSRAGAAVQSEHLSVRPRHSAQSRGQCCGEEGKFDFFAGRGGSPWPSRRSGCGPRSRWPAPGPWNAGKPQGPLTSRLVGVGFAVVEKEHAFQAVALEDLLRTVGKKKQAPSREPKILEVPVTLHSRHGHYVLWCMYDLLNDIHTLLS